VITHVDVIAGRDVPFSRTSRGLREPLPRGGAKLTSTGRPKGSPRCATGPTTRRSGTIPPGYLGYAAVTQAQVDDAIDWAYANGVQILTHANGEGAQDMLIAAVGRRRSGMGRPTGARR
jgi:predicted amidohydrolase YtcJ